MIRRMIRRWLFPVQGMPASALNEAIRKMRVDGMKILRATHIDYMHPKHLRGIGSDGRAYCVSPSCRDYAALSRKALPSYPRPAVAGFA